MTPMEKAQKAFATFLVPGEADSLEAAIAAYLQALASDEATVERVAKAIQSALHTPAGEAYWTTSCTGHDAYRIEARAALLSLTPTKTTGEGG